MLSVIMLNVIMLSVFALTCQLIYPLYQCRKKKKFDDVDYRSMTGAGQSYGIVTEFLYKIYPKPETLPILAMIYLGPML